MPTDTILLLALGFGAILWCSALVLWLIYIDTAQRRSALELMNDALAVILERSGELKRRSRAGSDTA